MKTKEELAADIQKEINQIKKKDENFSSSVMSDATNRVAISNLYIALSNLTK